MHDDKDFNSHFDEWYFEKKKNNGHFSKHSFSSSRNSRSSMINHWLNEAGDVIGDIVEVFRNRSTLHQYERQRLDMHKKLVRRIERLEKSLETRQKFMVISAILTVVVPILSWEFPPILLFGGLTAYLAYSIRHSKEKLAQLHSEYQRLEQGDFPMPVTYAVERSVIQHAYKHNGKVYPELLSLEADLSLSQAEGLLSSCVQKRLASIELDTDGRTYYYFSRLDTTDPYASL